MKKPLMAFVNKFKATLENCYSESSLEAVARQEGFIKRKRKLFAIHFIKCLLLDPFNHAQVSLRDHAIQSSRLSGKSVTKQSWGERFTSSAVGFIRQLLNQQMSRQLIIKQGADLMKKFTAIYIQDSTRFALPITMKDEFKGYGGATHSDSIANIQFCYELKSGRIAHLQLNDASYQDQIAAREVLPGLQTGALIIRDLGYFVLEILQKINACKAYFISRLKPKVTLYEQHGDKWAVVDLKSIKKQLKRKRIAFLEKHVWLGEHKVLPVRLYVSLASAQVVEKRLRKVNKQNKGYGHNTSQQYKDYAALNLFITNADEHLISSEDIPKLYRLRWQIELIFKTWKSYYQLHQLKAVNPHRVLCYLYASLLLLLLHWDIFQAFTSIHYQDQGRWISLQKFAKFMKQFVHEQHLWFDDLTINCLQLHLFQLYDFCATHMLLEKRKNRINYSDIIQIL